jgi:phytoene desaturase
VIFESARITSRLLLEDLEIEPMWDTGEGSRPLNAELVGAAS